MEPDLLGYLLNALDVDDRKALDQHLEANPAARRQLVALRHMLHPLDVEPAEFDPPANLLFDTLRGVCRYRAEQQIRQGVPATPPKRPAPAVAGRSRWRRADVLVAASIAVMGLL